MLTIYGCRGTIPVSGYEYVKYGGCTPSLFMQNGDVGIIFDAGTGIYKINQIKDLREIHIFLSHLHWDHIMGLPLFSYFYKTSVDIYIYIEKKDGMDSTTFIRHLFKEPFFPVSHERLSCNLMIVNIEYEKEYNIDNVIITPFEGNHPNGASMFLLGKEGKKYLYATDFEHGTEKDDVLRCAATGVDYFIFDTTYTPDDYNGKYDGISKKGWGHSTFEFGAEIADFCKVRNFVLFHHNPNYVDTFIEKIEVEAKRLFKNTMASYEGLVLK